MTHPEFEPNQFATLHRLASARIPAARLRQHIHASGGAWEQLLSPNPKLPWTKRQIERLETAAHAPLDETLLVETAIRGRVNAVCCADPEYPKSLLPFDDAPAVLFVRGTLPQDTPSIAIVGSRRPDPYGTRQARRFADAFSRAGCVVVSGGAAGIDTAAHEATLEQAGCTVAV
ncbi:MAG: DNA-processing protein DprA, partial [Armatimonadaceae bacterium]